MTTVQRVIGLDAHPAVFTAAALTPGNNASQAVINQVTDSLALDRLERWATTHTTTRDLFVLEASGNSFDIVARLKAIDRAALVLESARVGQIEKTYCTTDKHSAVKIARVYLSGLAISVWVPDDITRGRRDILNAYLRADQDSVRARNRLKGFLSGHGKRLPKGTRLTQPSGLKTLLGLAAWTPLQHELLRMMQEDLARTDSQRKRLRTTMAMEVTRDPNLLKLMRLFGVRHIVAFALAAYIGDIRRFASPKQLVAYIGLNPRVRFSGQNGYTGALAHSGQRKLRSLLAEAAHTILRCQQSPLHAWGWKIYLRKNRNCAAIAIARKLAVACWYLMHNLFTPLQELDSTIKLKIHKVVTCIGKQNVLKIGFKTCLEYEKHIQQTMLLSA